MRNRARQRREIGIEIRLSRCTRGVHSPSPTSRRTRSANHRTGHFNSSVHCTRQRVGKRLPVNSVATQGRTNRRNDRGTFPRGSFSGPRIIFQPFSPFSRIGVPSFSWLPLMGMLRRASQPLYRSPTRIDFLGSWVHLPSLTLGFAPPNASSNFTPCKADLSSLLFSSIG